MDRLEGRDAEPQRVDAPATIEHAGRGQAQLEPRGVDATKYRGNVLRGVAVDLTDEAQRQVELFVALPTRTRNTAHRAE